MRKSLFLYLGLVCFCGLIAVFIVDGYMGVYDTVYIASGEQSLRLEADVWLREDTHYLPSPERGEKVSFRYEIDNRQFSTYKADIEVSVWHSGEKVRSLISQPMSIAAFNQGELEWVVDNTLLLPKDILPEQSYQYTVSIKRGEIERKMVMSINRLTNPVKVVPAPPTPTG